MIKIESSAKLNLVLNIVGVRDNMHLLDMILTDFPIYDTILLEKNKGVKVVYTNCKTPNNDTAEKMARLICDYFGLEGVYIEITKRIPFGAGLGGSSADASGVARGISKLYDISIPNELLLKVGSDVPYMYYGGDKRVKGLGEIVEVIELPKVYKVLVVPNKGVDTKNSYSEYDKNPTENIDIDVWLKDFDEGKLIGHNCLQKGSERLNTSISEVILVMERCGFQPTMTGSGSGVFACEKDYLVYKQKVLKLKSMTNLQVWEM